MDSQEARTIAIMTTWLDGWYQSALWRATVKAAKEQNVRVMALVNYAPPGAEAQSGPEGIWGLACRSDFQGALLSAGPVSRWEGVAGLNKIREWLFQKPAVSLGLHVPHMDSVVSGGLCMSEIVSHLVKVHGCKKIAWIAGPKNNEDSELRQRGFLEGLEQLGIPIDPTLMEEGDFTLEAGFSAMERLFNQHPDLDGVVAANDAMAIGAMHKVQSLGLEIPDRIRIFGFDDIQEAECQNPPLSTIRNPIEGIASHGVQLCLDRIQSAHRPFVVMEESLHPVYRESCGCVSKTDSFEQGKGSSQHVARLAEFKVRVGTESTRFSAWLRAFLANAEREELSFWENEVYHLLRTNGSQEIYLSALRVISDHNRRIQMIERLACDSITRNLHRIASALASNPDPQRMLSNLADSLRGWCNQNLRLFILDREFSPLPMDTNFSKCDFEVKLEWKDGAFSPIPEFEDILPEIAVAGDHWIALPLEHRGMRFGLLVLQGWSGQENSLEVFRVMLSMALSDSWRTRSETILQERLKQLIARDGQTKLWNRMGFLEAGHQMVAQAFREKTMVGILLIEMEDYAENLKRFGKEDTQLGVRIVADALRECFRTSDILGRLEEDTFVALFSLRENADQMRMLSRVQKSLQDLAEKRMLPWRISNRVGWTTWGGADGSTLKAQIEIAAERARGLNSD